MGNSQGREARPPPSDPNDPANDGANRHSSYAQQQQAAQDNVYNGSRQNRGSNSNIASLFQRDRDRDGPQDEAALAARREAKNEREKKRAAKEKEAKDKERERSMREESVDGGFLVTQGQYKGAEDYNKAIMRALMIDRRLAPYWAGVDDIRSEWADHQIIAAVQRRPIPRADQPPRQIPHWPPADGPVFDDGGPGPSNARPPASTSTTSANLSSSPASASGLLRGRAKGAPSLTVPNSASGADPSNDLTQREYQLPLEPLLNGERLELFLYKNAEECPLCCMEYPPFLNRTRCCDQLLCTECFASIRRKDPHPPEHHNDANNPTAEIQIRQAQEAEIEGSANLVSEPAQCPFCKQTDFGVTYQPPPFRRGLAYHNALSASPSPLPSPTSPTMLGARRRAESLPANATAVITADRIRPEWSTKLATARAHAERRSAAATALHTAAYMQHGRQRRINFFSRGSSSRGTPEDGGESSNGQGQAAHVPGQESTAGQRLRQGHNRYDDINDMMVEEAIRRSLKDDQERRKKEEKDRKREEKEQAKEDKKAQKEAAKAARKASGSGSFYGLRGASRSNLTVSSAQPSTVSQDSGAGAQGKGKAPARDRSSSSPYLETTNTDSSQNANAQAHLERSRANLQPPTETGRPSNPKELSNTSSDSSLTTEPFPRLALNVPGSSTEETDSSNTTPSASGAIAGEFPNYQSILDILDREKGEDTTDNTAQTTTPDVGASQPAAHNTMSDLEKDAGPHEATPPVHVEQSSENGDVKENGHAGSNGNASTKYQAEVTSEQIPSVPLR